MLEEMGEEHMNLKYEKGNTLWWTDQIISSSRLYDWKKEKLD